MKVLEAIQEAAGAVSTLITSPSSLELPSLLSNTDNSHNNDDDTAIHQDDLVNTPAVAAILLDQVIQAIRMAFPQFPQTDSYLEKSISDSNNTTCSNINDGSDNNNNTVNNNNGSSNTEGSLQSALKSGIDQSMWNHLGILVPLRMFNPTVFGTATLAPLCLSSIALEALKDVLLVIIQLPSGESNQCRFSLLQYYALLDLYGESKEVKEVLTKHSNISNTHSEQVKPDINSIEQLQNGALSLSITVHPTVAYVLQLRSIITASSENKEDGINLNENENNNNGDCIYYSNVSNIRTEKAVRSLDRVLGALKARKEASSAISLGDSESAVRLVTEALEREYSPQEEEEDEEENEGKEDGVEKEEGDTKSGEIKSLLPVFIQVQLLVNR